MKIGGSHHGLWFKYENHLYDEKGTFMQAYESFRNSEDASIYILRSCMIKTMRTANCFDSQVLNIVKGPS